MIKLKHWIFWPPLTLIVLGVLANITAPDIFLTQLTNLNQWILEHFGKVFAYCVLSTFLMCLLVLFLPFGSVRIGGEKAQPLLKPWNWICIALCTNTTIGILFWASAEPLYHFMAPPKSLAIDAQSYEAAQFALSSLYMHWSFLPCSVYTLPGMLFAFAFYNMKQEFSLAAALTPLFGNSAAKSALGSVLESLCLYALIAGMAASLATSILTLSGGLEHITTFKSSPSLWGCVTLIIVGTFVLSSASGLQRGISMLASINTWVFLGLGLFMLFFGPTSALFKNALYAFKEYLVTFFPTASTMRFGSQEPWLYSWTIFYWGVWLSWAPVTGAFLGRIAYGYTMRSFILVNLFIPSFFAILWMSLFGGTALEFQMTDHLPLVQALQSKGPESVIYTLLQHMPAAGLIVPLFVFTVFISYITGADANISAIAGMCSKTVSTEKTEPQILLKILWGIIIGVIAFIMLRTAGITGIKMLSNLGGVPASIYEILAMLALGRVLFFYRSLSQDEQGGEQESHLLTSIEH